MCIICKLKLHMLTKKKNEKYFKHILSKKFWDID